ncbi:MAG: hypothetical protein ACRC33_26125 [Gemmataceae bacterium]
MPASCALVALLLAAPNADPEGADVIRRVVDHFAAIRSLRVRGVEVSTKTGGLWAEDPEGTPAVPDPDGVITEFDMWSSPPKYRWFWTQRKLRGGPARAAPQAFYDGDTVTHLYPDSRTGQRVKGGKLVTPPNPGSLHGVGFCFLDTSSTSLGALLRDSPHATAERLGGGRWMVEVRGLPDGLRPRDWSERRRKRVVVRLWLTLAPGGVRVDRWAMFDPRSSDPKENAYYARTVPAFQLDGHILEFGFVNCYGGGTDLKSLKRVLMGNTRYAVEARIEEIAVNPKEPAGTFRPAAPPGYAVTDVGEMGESELTISGGRPGVDQRIREVTKEAKALLASDGDALKAPPAGALSWAWPAVSCALVLAGAVVLIMVRMRGSAP